MPMTNARQIRLKEALEAADMTLEQLAEATGISVSYLSRLGSGKRTVSLKHLRKISLGLGIPAIQLVIQDPL